VLFVSDGNLTCGQTQGRDRGRDENKWHD
jgi:hypothetical protein